MATNKVQEGKTLYMAVQSGVTSGDPEMVGAIGGVALTDRDAAGYATLAVEGVYDLSVKGVNDAGNSAVAIGDLLYWVTGDTPQISKKSTAGKLFGVALEAVNSGATETINVKLVGVAGPDLGVTGTAHFADAVTLTDSTGQSSTHDDTLAATTVPATLTGTLTGTVNGALVDVAATAGSCAGGSSPTATNVDSAIATAVASIVSGVNEQLKELMTQVNAVTALQTVECQNASDIGQKVIELVTKVNAILLALEKAGILADS